GRELEDPIGLFINTLVLRSDLSGDPTVEELLRRIRGVALEAYSNQDVPFEKLVRELQPERDMSRTPLFQVMFVLQNTPAFQWELPGLRLEEERLDLGVSRFDLSLQLAEQGGLLRGELIYSKGLFENAVMGRMVRHLEMVLAGIVTGSERRVGGLEGL